MPRTPRSRAPSAVRVSGRSATPSRSTRTSSPRRTTTRSTCGTGSSTSTPSAASPRSTRPTCAAGSGGWGSTPSARPGFDGGKTAMLEEEELDDEFFMMRVRSDGKLLSSATVRALGEVGQEYARDTADVTDRENIQYHWIRIEDVPAIWERLDASGLDTIEACGDSPRPFLGSPVAGVAVDEIIDGSSALDEIKRRAIDNPAFSNLPRKYKTALTGHPSHDVSPETNDIAFVGTVAPRARPGLRRLGRRRPVDQPDAGPEDGRLGRRSRRSPDIWEGVDLDLPRLRLPPAALARPPEVPGRRLGRRQVPRGARERVPRPPAGPLRLAALPDRPPRPRRGARAEGRQLLRRRRARSRAGSRAPRSSTSPTSWTGSASPAPA